MSLPFIFCKAGQLATSGMTLPTKASQVANAIPGIGELSKEDLRYLFCLGRFGFGFFDVKMVQQGDPPVEILD